MPSSARVLHRRRLLQCAPSPTPPRVLLLSMPSSARVLDRRRLLAVAATSRATCSPASCGARGSAGWWPALLLKSPPHLRLLLSMLPLRAWPPASPRLLLLVRAARPPQGGACPSAAAAAALDLPFPTTVAEAKDGCYWPHARAATDPRPRASSSTTRLRRWCRVHPVPTCSRLRTLASPMGARSRSLSASPNTLTAFSSLLACTPTTTPATARRRFHGAGCSRQSCQGRRDAADAALRALDDDDQAALRAPCRCCSTSKTGPGRMSYSTNKRRDSG
jgi:hypothetical protein